MMNYRLGLDLGTNSIGWALWTLGESGPEKILDAGVRIFSDGREPGKAGIIGESLAVTRRTARGMRRRRDRLLQRKRVLVNAMVQAGLWPNEPDKRMEPVKTDPYKLRVKALAERLSGEELGCVLLHICQRRGFKSNRKEEGKDDEKGKNKVRIHALNDELSNAGYETLGEYLNANKRMGARFRDDSQYYPDRKHYYDEFASIRDCQKEYFQSLDWLKLEEIIFTQRPLKAQIKGKCPYYTKEDRAHTALPSTHRFRILQELSNLIAINPNGETQCLSNEERDCIYEHLEHTQKVKFSAIRKLLNKKVPGIIMDESWRFNLESEKRQELNGNLTSCIMRKPECFGEFWDGIDDEKQDEIIYEVMEAEDEEHIKEYLSDSFKMLTSEQRDNIAGMTFGRGIARFCSILHRECVHIMKYDYCGYSDAMAKLGFDHRAGEGKGEMSCLPYYGEIIPESCVKRNTPNQNQEEAQYGKIGNPTVHIVLNQLRRVVNSIIAKHGKPSEVVIELARDLKNGKMKISEIISEQTKNKKMNEELDKALSEVHRIPYPSRDDREKLMYFNELARKNSHASCPYCGKGISAEELFNGNIEVEHILPFSRTLDDSRGNKTIAHRRCNQAKTNRSPYEAFGHSPQGYNWDDIQDRIKTLPYNKRNKFRADAMEKREKDGSFLSRQLTDDAYASRVSRRYLTAICPPNKIWAITGRHTANLRWAWELNTILSKEKGIKNRSDHRHHALDAVVIGLVDRSLIKKIADANKKLDNDFGTLRFIPQDFPGGLEGKKVLASIIHNILPSIKPDHGIQGRFFKETAYGQIRKPLPLKTENLKDDMVEKIVSCRIRMEFQKAIAEKGFKATKNELLKKYPVLYLFEELWVTRKPITSLKLDDLKIPEYGSNTKGPSDIGLRKKLREYINQQSGENENPKDKELVKILEKYRSDHGIRHVRYIPKNQAITSIKSSPGKGYEIEDYAYVEIWRIPQNQGSPPIFMGDFIPRLKAAQIEQGICEQDRPHPAAKKIVRLFKNDTLKMDTAEGIQFYQMKGFNQSQNKIDIQPIWKADEDWYETVNPVSLNRGQLERTAKQNFKSINALWNKGGIRKITVHCDGSFR